MEILSIDYMLLKQKLLAAAGFESAPSNRLPLGYS